MLSFFRNLKNIELIDLAVSIAYSEDPRLGVMALVELNNRDGVPASINRRNEDDRVACYGYIDHIYGLTVGEVKGWDGVNGSDILALASNLEDINAPDFGEADAPTMPAPLERALRDLRDIDVPRAFIEPVAYRFRDAILARGDRPLAGIVADNRGIGDAWRSALDTIAEAAENGWQADRKVRHLHGEYQVDWSFAPSSVPTDGGVKQSRFGWPMVSYRVAYRTEAGTRSQVIEAGAEDLQTFAHALAAVFCFAR